MRRAIVVVRVYLPKLRLIVLRAIRCTRPCDRLPSPLSVMLSHLRITRNEINNSGYCAYPLKHISRLVASFIPFMLSLISFTSFFVIISLCFAFNNFYFFSLSLTCTLKRIGLILQSASSSS